jgi:hypothetical protein
MIPNEGGQTYCRDWCLLPRYIVSYWLYLFFFSFEWNPCNVLVIQSELTDVGKIDLEPLCGRLYVSVGNNGGSYFHFRLASLLRSFKARCLLIIFIARSPLPRVSISKHSVHNIVLSTARERDGFWLLLSYCGSVSPRIKRHSRDEIA